MIVRFERLAKIDKNDLSVSYCNFPTIGRRKIMFMHILNWNVQDIFAGKSMAMVFQLSVRVPITIFTIPHMHCTLLPYNKS